MKTRLQSALFAAAALLGGLSLTASMRADTLNVVLTSSSQTAAPGSTVTYSGTVSAPSTNGAPLYIREGDINFFGPSDITTDTTDLLYTLNFPDTVLAPGASAAGDLFTVTVPTGETLGSYTGDFYILGGSASDYSGSDTLATVPFTVTVGTSASVTPEPSSYLLLATGLTGVYFLVRRQRNLLS